MQGPAPPSILLTFTKNYCFNSEIQRRIGSKLRYYFTPTRRLPVFCTSSRSSSSSRLTGLMIKRTDCVKIFVTQTRATTTSWTYSASRLTRHNRSKPSAVNRRISPHLLTYLLHKCISASERLQLQNQSGECWLINQASSISTNHLHKNDQWLTNKVKNNKTKIKT